MGHKKKESIEFRYYELPQNEKVMALVGDKWKRIYGRDTPGLHFHNLLEIGYCYDGVGDLILEDEFYRFKGQMISAIPKNFPHTTLSDLNVIGYWEYLFIDDEGFLNEIYKEDPLFAREIIYSIHKHAIFLEAHEHERLKGLIQDLFYELAHKKPYYLESIKGLLLSLLLEIARINQGENEVRKVSMLSSMQIENALTYVAEKYFMPLKIEELAAVCHISEPHFRRLFVEYMNMTPVEYVNLVRIQKACELIKKGNNGIKEIAIKVGYPTPSTFDRNFKRLVGMSPNQWKKRADNYESKLVNYKISTLKGW